MFTQDWFSNNIPCIQNTLQHVDKNRYLKIIEIGVFQGRSTTFWLENLPNASITCIDTFEGSTEHQGMHELENLEDIFRANIEPYKDRVEVLKGFSQDHLFTLKPNTYDIIFIDASHTSYDFLTDAILSFHLLKKGGLLICDDYGGGDPRVEDPLERCIKTGCDVFAHVYRKFLTTIHVGYQIHFRKV